MKKFVLGFGLALLAVGCSNEVLVEEQQNPQEEVQTPISFATFADKQVRSQSVLMEDYHNTIAVYGVKENVTVQTVFNNVTLNYTPGGTPNDWAYSPLRYWDKQADYQFIAFAHASAPMAYVLHTDGKVTGGHFQTSAPYTLVGQNLQNGTSNEEIYTGFTGEDGKDTDIMLAPMVPADGVTKGIVNFDFHHILSKLNVAVKLNASLGGSVVKVKNITITGLKNTGTYLDASGWTADPTLSDPDYKLQFNNAPGVAVNATKALYFLESLVMPQV
ncbi:MAG: fimbrillin family protein, partial [Bacteroidaceae bacterium]|nr:fimbrillin family protein [Bacteroidaceae bacterium]